MFRHSIAFAAVAVLTLGLVPGATAADRSSSPDQPAPTLKPADADLARSLEKGPVLSLGTGAGRQLYLVQLEDAAVPSYTGGVKGLAPVQSPDREYRPNAARERAYRDHVVDEQAALRSSIADVTGRRPQVRFSYTEALNGIAVSLTRSEARRVAGLDGVAAVQVDEKRKLQTDVGPEWIGAPSIWDGSATPDGLGTKGEGVVAGIIDSGINPANPSFADSVPEGEGGDGYDHTNPLGAGNYLGVCDPANTSIYIADWGCNDKLIGAWDFVPDDGTSPYDSEGHGSHTASTTAGNQVSATTYSAEEDPAERFSATRTIKGVAPHANIIAYDVCADGCPLSSIVAGIEQAIDDDVDVINYSIGSSAASNPWTDPDAAAFLNARAAGVHVATSAGNDGPGASTVGSPADVPWVTSAGATTHNRQWRATIEDLTADGGAAHPDIQGLAFANATDGSYPLVDARDLGSNLCLADELAGQDLTGQIVVCERGENGRVEKGQVVAALGAEGMILVNDVASGDSLNADPHALPAVHITYDDGVELRDWMASVEGEQASLSGGQEHIGDDVADIMAAFSSRGPNRAVEMISPSVSAPGVDILAAEGVDNEVKWGFISGTSMASPHVAGSLALLASANPEWTPAEAQSALMTTSVTDITDSDGTPADWFDMGSGRVDLTKAADAGLVLDVSEADYRAADPTLGGDVKELNTASMANRQCLETCSWTRTVTATGTGAGTWSAEGSGVTDGIDLTIEPATFTLAEGETQEITVTASVAGAPTNAYQFGTVVLTPPEGSTASPAHLPVAALPSTGVIPGQIDIDTRRDAGSQESEPIESVATTDLQIQANGLVPERVQQVTGIPQDTTNDDVYDGNGVKVIHVVVPAGSTRFIANLTEGTANDFDLYVGKGDVSAANERCASTTSGPNESCDIVLGDGDAGDWWVLIQNWDASSDAPGATDSVNLGTAVVGGDEGNLRAEGPAATAAGEPYRIRAFWDEPRMHAGQTWYGSLTLDAAPAGTRIGTIPVTVNRFEDDVTKTVDKSTGGPGDTLTYTVEVKPNVTPDDLTYTIEDTLPEGTTYVEGSATGGASVADGVVTWEGTMPTAQGAEGDYVWSSNATDPDCQAPFGDGGYVDLASFGIPPQSGVAGDSTLYTAFSDRSYGFYEASQQGLGFTDDGFLLYGGPDGYVGTPFQPQRLPSPAEPNNLAAMLWQDMGIVYDGAAGSGVSIATAGDALGIIEYDDMRLFRDPAGDLGTYDFEAFAVTGSRDLVFAYDNLDGPLGAVTIGAENATGEHGSALVNLGSAAGTITDGTVVCGRYNAAQFDAKTFSYQVTIDDDVRNGQVLSNRLVHEVDNPGARRETVISDVTVKGAARVPAIKVIKKRDARQPHRDGVVAFRRPAWSVGKRLTVNYRVGGTARRGRDFRGLDGRVTFARKARTVKEFVFVVNRRGHQKTRIVRIALRPGDGYRVGRPHVARVRIVDTRRRGR